MNTLYNKVEENERNNIIYVKTEKEWLQYKKDKKLKNDDKKDNYMKYGTIYGKKYCVKTDYGDWDSQFTLKTLEDFICELYDNEFVKDLPNIINFDINIYNQLIQIKELQEQLYINDTVQWTIENKSRESYWIVMKPMINKIYKEIFIKTNLYKKIDYPVIHFRCSDVPFGRQIYYHFNKYKYYYNSLLEIKKTLNFDKIIILSCTSHYNHGNNCNIYLLDLQEYIESLGYKVIVECNDTINDFATIFYAPAVISSTSSFSFMSGFFSDGIFISTGHFNENTPEIKCYECGSWLKHNNALLHSTVIDYTDDKTVIKQLREL
jgi:hypothetical protein